MGDIFSANIDLSTNLKFRNGVMRLIRTKRLVLRNYTIEDFENFYRLKSNNIVWKYSMFHPVSDMERAKDDLQELIKKRKSGDFMHMAVFDNSTHEYIGECGIVDFNERMHRGILECHLLPQYWNKGYGTEIVNGILKYSFNVKKMKRIEVRIFEQNKASSKVLTKCGFLCEGTMRAAHKGNHYVNLNYYALSSIDYKRMKSKSEILDAEVRKKTLTKQL